MWICTIGTKHSLTNLSVEQLTEKLKQSGFAEYWLPSSSALSTGDRAFGINDSFSTGRGRPAFLDEIRSTVRRIGVGNPIWCWKPYMKNRMLLPKAVVRRSSIWFEPKCADAFREILIRSPLLAVSHAAARGVPPAAGGVKPDRRPWFLTAVLILEGVSDKHPIFFCRIARCLLRGVLIRLAGTNLTGRSRAFGETGLVAHRVDSPKK